MATAVRTRKLVRWAGRHAWSRAGAVARVLATKPVPRRLSPIARTLLLVSGSVTIGTAVALMLWDDLGPGPLDVFIVAIRDRAGLPLAPAMWVAIGAMMLASWTMGRRPGAGTVLAPLVIGPVAQILLGRLDDLTTPTSITTLVVLHVGAIGIAGIGAGALIVSGLGAGSGELLAAAASDRSGHSEPRVRLAFEGCLVVLGVLLGGPVGLGTVIVVLLIGPAVALGYRLVDGATQRWEQQPIVTEPAPSVLTG
jgi:uncharacterized membrane protein YczE